MADALQNHVRFIRGGSEPIMCPTAVDINVGDLVVIVNHLAVRASSLGDSGTLAQNQTAAKIITLGSALDQNKSGDTRNILIQPDGQHRYPCVALGQAYDIGQYFGYAGTGTALAVGVADQQLVPVATAALAIARLAYPAALGDTSVIVELAAPLGTPFAGPQVVT